MSARHEIANWVDRRTAIRHKLRLSVQETSPTSGEPTSSVPPLRVNALVHSLSTGGALIECKTNLAVGEMLEVGLADTRLIKSRIVWSDGRLSGCKFERPISRAMLNAALLKGVNIAKVSTPQWLEGLTEATGAREAEIWPKSFRIAMIAGLSLSIWAMVALYMWQAPGLA